MASRMLFGKFHTHFISSAFSGFEEFFTFMTIPNNSDKTATASEHHLFGVHQTPRLILNTVALSPPCPKRCGPYMAGNLPNVTWPWGQKLKFCDELLKGILHLHNGKLQDCEWNTLYTVYNKNPITAYKIKGHMILENFNFPMLNSHKQVCKYGPYLYGSSLLPKLINSTIYGWNLVIM